MAEQETFGGWAILELMGHRRLAGYVQEASIAGGSFLRLDVPNFGPQEDAAYDETAPEEGDVMATQFYSPSAVYCITPTTEKTARAVAARNRPTPAQRWELEPVPVFTGSDENLDDEPLF